MQEIDIKTNGIILNEPMRKHINQRLHSVFGFDTHQVRKITVTLFDDKNTQGDFEKSCHIEIQIIGKPTINTELKSLDIYSAISLAIERTHLKLSHNLLNEKITNKQTEHNSIYQL